MRYSLLLFDFDGTLADTSPAIKACHVETARTFGVEPVDEKTVEAFLHLPLGKSLPGMYPDLPENEIQTWVAMYRKLYAPLGLELTRPFPGIREVLDQAKDGGAAMAVTSNKGEEALRASLASTGLEDYFTLIVGDTGDKPLKPDPLMYFAYVLPKHPHITLDQVLVVGDTETDLAFAENVGCSSCWAAYGYGRPEVCRARGPRHTAHRVGELISFL